MSAGKVTTVAITDIEGLNAQPMQNGLIHVAFAAPTKLVSIFLTRTQATLLRDVLQSELDTLK